MGRFKMAKMASTQLVFILFCVFSVALSQNCGQNWFEHNGSCYLIGGESVTWTDAEEICEFYGGRLAVIEDKAENDYLKNYVKASAWSKVAGVWLGASDILSEGNWQWVRDIAPFTFTDWYNGEPNNGSPGPKQENCLMMFVSFDWAWNDALCSETNY